MGASSFASVSYGTINLSFSKRQGEKAVYLKSTSAWKREKKNPSFSQSDFTWLVKELIATSAKKATNKQKKTVEVVIVRSILLPISRGHSITYYYT